MESLSYRALCKEYSRALAAGEPAPEAFSGLAAIEPLLPRTQRESLRLSMAELIAAGYVISCPGDDATQLYVLTTSGRAAGREIVRHVGQSLLSLLKTILPWAQ